MSDVTLNKAFFNDLWPLILEYNQCDTKSRDTSPSFEPLQQFDYIWAHELLAAKGYKNYTKPIELKCSFAKTDEVQQNIEAPHTTAEDEQTEVWRKPKIIPLDEQIDALQEDEWERQTLAYEYINRKFPWYIERPIWDASFEITDAVRHEFVDEFEMEILRNIFTFQCKLMIIDVGADVGLGDLERWLKFCRYVQMLAVVRCEVIERRLRLLGDVFSTLLVQEDLENTWQEELKYAHKSDQIGRAHV